MSVVNGSVRMDTTAVSRSFIEKHDLDMDYNDDEEKGAMYYKLDKLIEDVKNSNYFARVFLLAQVTSDSLSIPGAGGVVPDGRECVRGCRAVSERQGSD